MIINSAVSDCFLKCHNIFPIRELFKINRYESVSKLSESRHSGKNLFLFEFNNKKKEKKTKTIFQYIHQINMKIVKGGGLNL